MEVSCPGAKWLGEWSSDMRMMRILWALALMLPADPAQAQRKGELTPCTTATASCTEWIAVAGDSSRLRVFRTYPLETRNSDITRAFILVHGAGRDADNYFRHALAAGFLGSALANTIIIAPRFASNNGGCRDTLVAGEWNWPCSGPARWTSGGQATNSDTATAIPDA